jgi:hypothetical protein
MQITTRNELLHYYKTFQHGVLRVIFAPVSYEMERYEAVAMMQNTELSIDAIHLEAHEIIKISLLS